MTAPHRPHGAVPNPLDPDRYPQGDFFVCDILDATPKGDMAPMEHPIFSLSTRPDTRRLRYENGRNWIEVRPSDAGLATIHDRDVLIFCISQLVAAMNEGREPSRYVRFNAADLMRATNRAGGGAGYERLQAAFLRLQGTQIVTNIVTGGEEVTSAFSLIDQVKIIRRTQGGRMVEVEAKLSDWTWNAIRAHEVLTLHRDYFRLRKPLERRIYEIARKHCGMQTDWRISLTKLHLKVGSTSELRVFRQQVGRIAEADAAHAHMPDYAVELTETDMVVFRLRREPAVFDVEVGRLMPETYQEARAYAPGWDVRHLEAEWRRWCEAEEIEPRNPDRHYLKFCTSWSEKRGRP
ncbi:Plasmid replication initiator protein [Albimonas donghaensis]|uniref:Plasmid replication initiator protein n=2 Tax=Albimonas donghaensis TaxID=356660 RepID=A0A1H3FNN7_9RHOB|nr:Plasmid replication initiator protein [Albimonas donghaensis]